MRRTLTVISLVAAAAAASADERVAFLAQSDGYWQVWVMRPDGTEARQVTRTPTEKARVSWYPGGRHVLVTEMPSRLVKVGIERGDEVVLDLGIVGVQDAAVSPSGEWLAVSANTGGDKDSHDIWLVRADGREPRRIAAMPDLQHEPRWSVDGAWVYFVSGDGQQDHDIWRASVETGAREQLTVDARYHFEIDVSKHGTVAFSSNRSGDYEVYALGSDGALVRWTDSPGLDGHPVWSPFGDALIFHSSRSGVINLWRQEGPSRPPRALTHFPQGARSPEWWSDR